MIKKILKFFRNATLSLCFLCNAAWAGSSDSGQIHSIISGVGGPGFFYTDGNRHDIPSCGNPTNGRYAVNLTTTLGQSIWATLLTAYSMGKKVEVLGSGTCSIWPDTEDLNYFIIND